ncbi:MAG TPA: OmpA family protein [Rhizomicrobium sp.]|jgi:outer membrane protein OmpA-like peptidoglycan-associated protein|nr:OmpA family protein [Rhizomicrobium sp.]
MKKALAAFPALLLLSACAGAGGHAPRYPDSDYGPPPALRAEPEGTRPQAAMQPMHPERPPQVASAGPLKTAMIGNYMDSQEKDLRGSLRGSGVLVTRRGDDIILQAPNAALFSGGTQLSENGSQALWAIAPVLRHYDHTAISISGYTDTTGSDEQNMTVSRKRAYTVGGQLVKNGVPLSRLHAQGFGETDLKIQTGDNVNEPRNRRIEIHITAQANG